MKISDKWYCEAPKNLISDFEKIVDDANLHYTIIDTQYIESDFRYIGRGIEWRDNNKYISDTLEEKYLKAGYIKIAFDDAVKLIKNYKQKTTTDTIKTSLSNERKHMFIKLERDIARGSVIIRSDDVLFVNEKPDMNGKVTQIRMINGCTWYVKETVQEVYRKLKEG
jgi:hypothetical protein